LLHHPTTWRERGTPLLLSKEGLILSKTEIDLPPTTSAAKKAQQTLRHCRHHQGGRQSTAAAPGDE